MILGSVDSVWRYPVKSMRGEEMEEAFIGFPGIYGDRLYAFRSSGAPEGFPYFTGRDRREMIRFRPRFRHPEKAARPVNLAQAQEINAAPLSASPEHLSVDVETPDGQLLAIDDPRLSELLLDGRNHSLTLLRSERALVDCRPVSLFSIQTAKQLGNEVAMDVDKRRFRASLYLDLPNIAPFGEEEFISRSIRIGSTVVISILGRDSRCMMVTLDPDTAEKSPALLKTIAQNHGGNAGLYGAVLVEGMARRGDPVDLIE
jgi:uncharacterized protein YcbX